LVTFVGENVSDVAVLSGAYTGEKTLYIVAIASSGDLKRWENFYSNCSAQRNL